MTPRFPAVITDFVENVFDTRAFGGDIGRYRRWVIEYDVLSLPRCWIHRPVDDHRVVPRVGTKAAMNLLAGKHTRHCGDVADRKFLATYHRDGRITAALAMNSARALVRARRTFATTTEEDDRCPSCSSTASGGTR